MDAFFPKKKAQIPSKTFKSSLSHLVVCSFLAAWRGDISSEAKSHFNSSAWGFCTSEERIWDFLFKPKCSQESKMLCAHVGVLMGLEKNSMGFKEFHPRAAQKLSSTWWTWSSVKVCSRSEVSELLKGDLNFFFLLYLAVCTPEEIFPIYKQGKATPWGDRPHPLLIPATFQMEKAEMEENPNLSQVGQISRWSPQLRVSKKFTPSLAGSTTWPWCGVGGAAGAADGFSRQGLGICCSVWPKQLLFSSSIRFKNLTTKLL